MRAMEFIDPTTLDFLQSKMQKMDPTIKKDPQELEQNPKMIPPLQQELELKKANAGKDSPVIQDLLQHEHEPEKEKPLYPFIKPRVKQ